jgi:hypothetical protein
MQLGYAHQLWIKIFCWLALKHRLWTSDRRARHGLQETPDTCFTCLQGEDNVEHILAHLFGLHATGLRVDIPQVGDTLEGWWLEARSGVTVANRRRFDTLVILVARTLWKQRNARVFANASQQFGTE